MYDWQELLRRAAVICGAAIIFLYGTLFALSYLLPSIVEAIYALLGPIAFIAIVVYGIKRMFR